MKNASHVRSVCKCGLFVAGTLLTVSLLADGTPALEMPHHGGTLRLARPADPQSLDPAISYDMEALLLTRLVFQGLVDFDDGVNVVPKQAIDWTISADQKIYVFHLKPGVRFANGREVEAADYIFSLQRIIDPKSASPGESFFNGIAGAKEFQERKTKNVRGLRAPDKYTLEIELEEPDYTFRFKMAMTFACVVPREAIERDGDSFWLHAFGTGPYTIKQWDRGVRLILERSPKPNQSDEGYLERIEVMIGGDRALHTMMFERDELDLVYLVQVPDLVRLSRVMTWKGTIRMIERAETDFLYLNTELPPFDEVKVRRAVNHAINKERLITLTAQSAVAARGILPPLMPGFNPEPKGLEFDPEKAKELLRDSGHAEGLVFDLWYTDDDPRWERAVFAIENDLRGVGITAKLKKVTYATLITAMQTRKRVACSFNGWGQDYPDPSNFLDVLFNGTRIQESGGNNLSYYNNAEVNRLLAEADRCFDLRERGRRYQGIEKIILQDAPVVPLMHTAAPMLVSEQVGGFKPHPVWQMRYERWWKANNSK